MNINITTTPISTFIHNTVSVLETTSQAKAHHNLYSCQSEFIEQSSASALSAKFICHAFEMCRCCNLNGYLLFDICSFGTMMQHKC